MSIQDTYNNITQQLTICFGLLILILGIIGGILNIIIFTTLKTFRETTCAFYLTILSTINIGQSVTGLLVKILSDGFNINIKKTSVGCKIQIYIASWFALVSMTILCLATIDQYISMSKYRYYNNKRLAKRCIILTCLFWTLYCICLPFYWNASSGVCTITDRTFAIYSSRFHYPVLAGFLPLSTMIIFSLLAYYNARTLNSRQINIVRLSRDRQLTTMTLCHVVYMVITTLPYVIFFIYSANQTSNDSEQKARNNLIYTIVLLIAYSIFASSFYIYYCVSERFRKQLSYVWRKIFIDRWQQLIINWKNNNQIVPDVELRSNGSRMIRTHRLAVEVLSTP